MEHTFTMLQQLVGSKFTTRDLAMLLFSSDVPTTSQIEMTSKEIKDLVSLGLIDKITTKKNIGIYELTEHGKETIKKTIETKERAQREKMEAFKALKTAEQKKLETEESYLEAIEDFLRKTQLQKIKAALNAGKLTFNLDFQELDKWNTDVADELLNAPDKTIDFFETAIETVIDNPDDGTLGISIVNLPESKVIPVSKLSCSHEKKLVSIEGVLRNASERYSVVIETEYECLECSSRIMVIQTQQTIRKPSKCVCGKKSFKEIGRKLVDCLKIRIEEDASGIEHQPNQLVGILDSRLAADNETALMAQQVGSKVRVVGTLRELPKKSNKGMFLTAMDRLLLVNSVEFLDIDKNALTLTPEEKKQIEDIAASPTLREDFRESLAPEISGHSDVKDGLVLQMFSGKSKIKGTKRVRGPIHLFISGDPAVAKSVLLDAVEQRTPKVRRCEGTGATKVGATASTTKNEDGKYEVSAGGMVLANGGIFIIDEATLLNSGAEKGTDALKGPMEQGLVHVDKANLHVTLPADTMVLGAANPKNANGRWDGYRTISENIGLDAPFLSRFDLIFIVKDIPDEKRDSDIADKVLGLSNETDVPTTVKISPQLFKKYLSYARRICKDIIIPETIGRKIKEKYLSMRKRSTRIGNDELKDVKITARQLEGMMRLTEAAARMRLSTVADEEDFEWAWNTFIGMATEIGIDEETGELNVDKFTGGVSMSKQNQVVRALEKFKQMSEAATETKGDIRTENYLDALVNSGICKDFSEATAVFERVRKDNLYEPRNGVLRLLK